MKILDFGRQVLGLSYSPLQETILLAARGESLTDAQAELFERHAGRPWPGPGIPPHEVHVICGRQSGKTGRLAPTLLLHAAMDPATVEGLEPGYWRDAVLVAPTRRQAGIAYHRIRGLLQSRPELRAYLAGEPTVSEIELTFGVRIGVWASRGAHLRGMQSRMLLLDEACFLPAEGHRADVDLIEAIRPGQAMVPGGQIVTISSPWTEQGYVYETWRSRAQLEGVLVFQAASWELNPSIRPEFLERERARDAEYFRREYGGEFIGTIRAFIPAESIEACVERGRLSLPPVEGVQYVAALDQAYIRDTFVLGIGHREAGRVVVDLLHGWKPGRGKPVQLELLLPELVDLLRPYRVKEVLGDQYSAPAFRELLRTRSLEYLERPFTAESKREMYGSLRQGIVAGGIELLDHHTSLRELRTVEARALPGGGVRIGAPAVSGFHDDYADVLAILTHELRPGSELEPGFLGYLRGLVQEKRQADEEEAWITHAVAK